MKIQVGNVTIIPSRYVCDYEVKFRTWEERLFTLPWRPLQRTKILKARGAYILDEKEPSRPICYVSYRTFGELEDLEIVLDCIKMRLSEK